MRIYIKFLIAIALSFILGLFVMVGEIIDPSSVNPEAFILNYLISFSVVFIISLMGFVFYGVPCSLFSSFLASKLSKGNIIIEGVISGFFHLFFGSLFYFYDYYVFKVTLFCSAIFFIVDQLFRHFFRIRSSSL